MNFTTVISINIYIFTHIKKFRKTYNKYFYLVLNLCRSNCEISSNINNRIDNFSVNILIYHMVIS